MSQHHLRRVQPGENLPRSRCFGNQIRHHLFLCSSRRSYPFIFRSISIRFNTRKAKVKRRLCLAALKTPDSKSQITKFLCSSSSIQTFAAGQTPAQKSITKSPPIVNFPIKSFIHDTFLCSGLFIACFSALGVPSFWYRSFLLGACSVLLFTFVHLGC